MEDENVFNINAKFYDFKRIDLYKIPLYEMFGEEDLILK